jgi:hypothetical protein
MFLACSKLSTPSISAAKTRPPHELALPYSPHWLVTLCTRRKSCQGQSRLRVSRLPSDHRYATNPGGQMSSPLDKDTLELEEIFVANWGLASL